MYHDSDSESFLVQVVLCLVYYECYIISTFLKGPRSVDELLSLFSSHYYVHIPANYPDACQNQLDDVGAVVKVQ